MMLLMYFHIVAEISSTMPGFDPQFFCFLHNVSPSSMLPLFHPSFMYPSHSLDVCETLPLFPCLTSPCAHCRCSLRSCSAGRMCRQCSGCRGAGRCQRVGRLAAVGRRLRLVSSVGRRRLRLPVGAAQHPLRRPARLPHGVRVYGQQAAPQSV